MSKPRPNRIHLTKSNVLALACPKGKRSLDHWDEGTGAVPGLHVRVQASGVRTYYVVYRLGFRGKEHRAKIGRVAEITLAEARDKANEIRKVASQGQDPKAGDARRTDTFKTCLETWCTNEQQGRKELLTAARSLAYVLTICKRWHERPIGTMTYGEIDDLLSTYREKAPYGSLRIHAHLKGMFRWAVRTRRIAASPMAEMPPPWLGAKPRERDWFADEKADDVIARLWNCATDLGGERERFMKLVLILGKRRGAIETMRWEHIDSMWHWKPTCGNKWKRCHAVPLPKLAQRVLSPREDKGRVLAAFDANKLRKRVRKLIGVDDFFWHGCRHMAETKMGELKVPPHVRDMLLDHAPLRGAGKGYDHGDYRDEMADALERWADHIARCVAPAEGVAVLR